MVMSRGRKRASISFHQLRTTASKASVQKQIIADAFGTPPHKPRTRDALWAVLSVVRRRLLPLRLRRVSSFDASAREIICSFATQHTAALWAVLSLTPIVRRRLSPLRLRRVSSFEVYCEETRVIPNRIRCKGFYLPILEKETLRRAEPLCLDEDRTMVWDSLRRSIDLSARRNREIIPSGITTEVPPVFLAGLFNASLLNDDSTIRSCDNILLCDTVHHPLVINSEFYIDRPPIVIPPVDLKLSGEYVHFGALWAGGSYYHWMLDVLPRLLFVERFDRLRGMPLIVQRGFTQTQRESLQILGIRPDRIIEFNGNHWQVEQLYYIQHGMYANPTPLHVQWLRERFAPGSITRSRRLYISREDATKRRIVNEADLVRELVPHGFEVVTLRGMSFADQARLFNEAEIIVGPHGAGFTNAVFAQPGTSVIELFSPSWINGCFWALANACGHRYGFTVGTQHGEDIEADIGKFLRLFASMN
jgi:Glycosyltransferase 61